MSNYPNMSYCAVENTNLALSQVKGLLEDFREGMGEFNRDEKVALGQLAESCSSILQDLGELVELHCEKVVDDCLDLDFGDIEDAVDRQAEMNRVHADDEL